MDLVEEIKSQFDVFVTESEKNTNATARQRARKASMKIEKLLKEYRKTSI